MNEHIKNIISALSMRSSYTTPFLKWTVSITLVLSVAAIFFANTLIASRIGDLSEEIHQRMQVQAGSKARIMETWLRGIDKLGNYIIEGDMVRLFASEVNNQGDNNQGLQAQLVAQLPYMRQMIREFVSQHKLQDAFMVTQKGHVYLSGNSKSGLLLTPSQEAGVKAAFKTQETQFLPIRQVGAEYVLEIVRPVMALDNVDQKVVSAFLMMVPIKAPISRIMQAGNFDKEGEKGFLLQQVGNKTWHINLNGKVSLKPIDFQDSEKGSVISSPIHGGDVFTSTAPVEGTYLVALYEYAKGSALETVKSYKKTIYTFISLGMLAIIAVILAIIWYMLGQRNRHRVKSQEQAIDALVRTVEIRDPYLSGHHRRVAKLVLNLSNKMKMPVKDRSTLYYSALLSGVGKIFVPQNILTKPGKLTDDERKMMENHVNHAINILGDIDFEFPIASVIHQMHERADGTGYPNKMRGDDINQMSRLLGICDVFCALTSPRSYRTRKTEEEAIKLMLEEKSRYDVVILSTLKSLISKQSKNSDDKK